MHFLYNLLIATVDKFLPFFGRLNPKMTLFAKGRTDVFRILEQKAIFKQSVIWMHCASLGEYEQGVPILESLKKNYPEYPLVITFFSPSGYEIKKNNSLAELTLYLPLDTKKNAEKFLRHVRPKIAIFVKYEIWPNYFKALYRQHIPILLISATFRKDHLFFKWYGRFMKKALQQTDHIFVQDAHSLEILENHHFSNVTLSGDTRFDRVSKQIERDNNVDFLSDFINHRFCIVMGSSWEEDETVFVDFINNSADYVCFIVAPHEIKKNGIQRLTGKINKKHCSFSEMKNKELKTCSVFILDTIGYLSRAYSYADIAYVGGAMGSSGLHNILEPATFGIPVIIGKNFEKFREAKQLQKLAGLYAVSTVEEFTAIMNKLIVNENFRKQTGMIAGHFINSNTGATAIIMKYINLILKPPARQRTSSEFKSN